MRQLLLIAGAVAAIAAGPVFAQSGAAAVVKSEPGKVMVAETVRVTATVEAIDKAKRLVTLKGPEGNSFVVQASPELKRFDQIKVGDTVVAQYIEALTLQLKKGGGQIRERIEREDAAVTAPGAAPGGVAGRQVTVIADVIALDAAKQTVRLQGPKRIVDLKVRDPQQFKAIKVGDQIEGTFTEAIAIALEPAAAPAPAPAPKK